MRSTTNETAGLAVDACVEAMATIQRGDYRIAADILREATSRAEQAAELGEGDRKFHSEKRSGDPPHPMRYAERYLSSLRADGSTPDQQAHRLAMAAKEMVFKSQDAAGYMEDTPKSRRILRLLAKIRSELEKLDRTVSS